MFDRARLAALEAILRLGSFDAAAAALNITPSAVSQRIRALEDETGTTLVIRSLPCTATPAGARLARHAADVALLDAALAAELGRAAGPARVRIAVNADSLATWLVPALAAVPGLTFDLVIDDQDHVEPLLRAGAVQAAVMARGRPVQGCDRHPLGSLRYLATAAPAFRDRWFPGGPDAASLAGAPCIVFSARDRLQADWAKAVTGQAIALPAHMIGSTHAFVDAALHGLGWAMNPEPLVRDHVADGRLVTLGPDLPLDVPLDWQVTRLAARPLSALTAAIRRAAASVLRP
jgi:LysR family transcriptional regulator (chromosome initiation inhibitor)